MRRATFALTALTDLTGTDMTNLLIRNVRPNADAALDILIEGDRIVRIGPSLDAPAGCAIEDGAGALALPGLVEGHTHLDKTHWGCRGIAMVGPRLVDRIENERHYRATSGHDAGAASLALARAFLAGTTRIRTHVDIDTEAGLRHLHGVLATRETLRGKSRSRLSLFRNRACSSGRAQLRCCPKRWPPGPICSAGPTRARSKAIRSRRWTCCSRSPSATAAADVHLHERGSMGAYCST